jgi:alanine racemase
MALFHRAPADQADTTAPEIPVEIRQKPTLALIHLDRMIRNLRSLKRLAHPAGLLPVIKADAYGHGLIRIAKALTEEAVEGLGVSFLEEGVALRRAGIPGRILVMGGIVNAQIDHFLEYDLDMTASSGFIAGAISEAAVRMGVRAKVHAKIDTGMSRIGVNWEQSTPFFEKLSSLPGLDVVGIYSHLATAETTTGEGYDYAREQIRRFRVSLDKAAQCGLNPPLIHIINTAGMLIHPDARHTLTRPGIALYGLSFKTDQPNVIAKLALSGEAKQSPIETHHPDVIASAAKQSPSEYDLQLEPVMELVSEIVFLKGVRKGTPISYGMTWRAPQNTWIATIPIGYGDGYPRAMGNHGQLLIRGKRYPIVGAVCMDQLMVDVGPSDPPDVGEAVTLIGRQDDDEITVDEICRITGHIPYEIPILLTTRVPRIYLNE